MQPKQNNSIRPVQPSELKVPNLLRTPGRFSLSAAALVILVVIGIAAGFLPRVSRQTEVGAETRELSIPTVNVVSPKPGQSTASLPLPAEIKPWIEAPIYARANGYLKRRFVDIGSHVEEGQLLAEIDTPELNQELERARAVLAQTEAALGLSKITAARWAGLLKTASVSEQENAEKQADFKLKSATTESARAEVRRLEKLQAFARVVAPFSGTITVRNIDTGDLIVAAGSKELFHMAQTHKLRVYVQVPQSMARSVTIGQTAEMSIPELPGRTFPATVIRTAGVIAADSRTLLVELEADNPKGEILAGGYAQIRFTEAKSAPPLTIPANTMLFRAEGPQVGVVQPDGKVELRSVKLGRDFGQTIEVLSGVTPEDRVIINPSESLVSGTLVSIAQPAKTEKDQ
jgi:RND family efflux transporter MFP subunit